MIEDFLRRRYESYEWVPHTTLMLHSLPVSDCPFDRRLDVAIPEARTNEVDLADLDGERHGWTRERLLAELDATRPADEQLVVCHGDACLPNVLFDPETLAVTGLIDLGRLGVADRYNDLALTDRSLRAGQFGPAYAARFLARYGDDPPDSVRLAFYRLLDEFF